MGTSRVKRSQRLRLNRAGASSTSNSSRRRSLGQGPRHAALRAACLREMFEVGAVAASHWAGADPFRGGRQHDHIASLTLARWR